MGRKKKHAEHANHERWLISYADFITLLFAFFVVMFSASQVDQRRLGAFSQSFAGATGETVVPRGSEGLMPGVLGAPPSQNTQMPTNPRVAFSMDNLATVLHSMTAQNPNMEEVRVIRRRNDFVLRMPDHFFFDSGGATVKPEAATVLAALGLALQDFPIDLRIEGHTDNVPISTSRFRSNWELSTSRATSVLQEMLATSHFPPDHLAASGYGEFRPVATNATDDGRLQNRRVDIVAPLRHPDPEDMPADGGSPALAVAAAVADAGLATGADGGAALEVDATVVEPSAVPTVIPLPEVPSATDPAVLPPPTAAPTPAVEPPPVAEVTPPAAADHMVFGEPSPRGRPHGRARREAAPRNVPAP